MKKMNENIGNAAAMLGIASCAVAGAARVAGAYHLGN